jgi:hypothetical protein
VDVVKWVGHKSLDTILHYWAKAQLEKKETQERVHRAFEQFAAVGD